MGLWGKVCVFYIPGKSKKQTDDWQSLLQKCDLEFFTRSFETTLVGFWQVGLMAMALHLTFSFTFKY